MPVYEYHCENCSFRFEIKRSFNDDSVVICPRCEGETRRIFSPVPVVFKGTGFYSTDNRHKGEPWHSPKMDEQMAEPGLSKEKSLEKGAE